jgi:endonuclease/exonuclease/phosphatase (EEP) superfamily protein YafD
VVVAVRALVGDRTAWGEWISVWPTVGWLVLFAPAVLCYRAWLAGAVLLAFVAGTTEWPGATRSAVVAERDLRVVVWNVSGNPAFLDAVADLEPDLVLAQESIRPPKLPRDWVWKGGLDPGTASRFPLKVLDSRPIGPWQDPQLLLAELPHGRHLLVANVRLMLPAPVFEAAHPLDALRGRDYHRQRVRQFPALARLLSETAQKHHPDAVLLAGDFNSPAGLPSLRPLKAQLTDVWPLAGDGWGGTAPEFLPIARIDQCWVSDALIPLRAFVTRRPGSDHRALVVDLAFR